MSTYWLTPGRALRSLRRATLQKTVEKCTRSTREPIFQRHSDAKQLGKSHHWSVLKVDLTRRAFAGRSFFGICRLEAMHM